MNTLINGILIVKLRFRNSYSMFRIFYLSNGDENAMLLLGRKKFLFKNEIETSFSHVLRPKFGIPFRTCQRTDLAIAYRTLSVDCKKWGHPTFQRKILQDSSRSESLAFVRIFICKF